MAMLYWSVHHLKWEEEWPQKMWDLLDCYDTQAVNTPFVLIEIANFFHLVFKYWSQYSVQTLYGPQEHPLKLKTVHYSRGVMLEQLSGLNYFLLLLKKYSVFPLQIVFLIIAYSCLFFVGTLFRASFWNITGPCWLQEVFNREWMRTRTLLTSHIAHQRENT